MLQMEQVDRRREAMQWENEIREILTAHNVDYADARQGDLVAELADLIERISTAEVESALAQDEEKRWAQEPQPVSTGRHSPEFIEAQQKAEWDAVNAQMLRYAIG